MTINELRIQLDLQPENRIDILNDVARKCNKGYIFVDSSNGHCYLFDRNGNEDDIKKLKKIDIEMFYGSNIESIVIPDSVESIRDFAFAYCRNLKSIGIPDSVENIGLYAFAYCRNLKSLAFKGKTIDKVKSMDNYPFRIKDESIIKCI